MILDIRNENHSIPYYRQNIFQHAELLKKSLDCLKLKYDIQEIPANDWNDAIDYKSKFLVEMLVKYHEKILYVGIDTFFHSDPTMYMNDIEDDIALRFKKEGNKEVLLSGTIFLNNNSNVRKLLKEWVNRNEDSHQKWDQKVLQEILDDELNCGLATIHRLPPQFTYIFGESGFPNITPVIEHLQASRELPRRQKILQKA